jgi:hypothetical protein
LVDGYGATFIFSTESSLGVAGAIVGAIAFIGIGEWINPPAANAEGTSQATPMASNQSREALAAALENVADQIAKAPPLIIGQQTTAVGGPGGGTVIGEQVTATAGPGSTGNVIGKQVTASSSDTPVNVQRAQELHDAASMVREGKASRSAILSLIARSRLPGINPTVNDAVQRAEQALAASDLP